MTKEQFLDKWQFGSNQLFEADLEVLIATEIAKVQEAKLKHADQVTDQVADQEKPKLNPIAEAYERGEKIRCNYWGKDEWIKKHSKTESITECNKIYKNLEIDFHFATHPEKWELYTKPTEPSSQVKLDNSFDKDRFEAMFRAVVASGEYVGMEFDKTAEALQQLDAYYATKNN